MWLLLAVKTGPKHMAAIKDFISERTNGTIQADDKSMYRALRRLTDGEMLSYQQVSSASGPDLKVYELTEIGQHTLKSFLQRNLISVLYNQTTSAIIKE